MYSAGEQQLLNGILETYLKGFWTQHERTAAEQEFGPILTRMATEVYDAAMSCPGVDWSRMSLDDGAARMQAFLNEQYPWLSPGARRNLNYAFYMCWK
jgi:hypothetical protein